MSSEKIKKPEEIRNDKILLLAKNIGLSTEENINFLNSFLRRLCGILDAKMVERHIEAIDFIIMNKPQDAIEVFHILHLFIMHEINMKMFFAVENATHNDSFKDFTRLAVKAHHAFSSGMIALKTYRTGINITKNFQNNTLNQTYIANPPQSQIEEKHEIKEVAKSDKRKIKT